MRTSRRLAPRSGSTSSWIIELNCFPRRVLRRKRPSGMSRSGSDTTVKRARPSGVDRKSTRLNSSHTVISYAVFCLKKKKKKNKRKRTKKKKKNQQSNNERP